MAVTVYEAIEQRTTTEGIEHIPGDAGWPVIGHSLNFVRDPFGFHQGRRAEYGPVYKSYIFGGWNVMLHGADALEMVLMDRGKFYSSFNGWRVLHKLFPDGLMLRDFDDHRAHRRVMQAAFKPGPMQDYVGRMNDRIAHSMDVWAGREGMRFYDAIKELTLDMGASVFLGLDMGPEARKLNQAFIDEVAASVAVIRKPIPGTKTWRGIRARAFLLDFFRDLIPQRRAGDGDDMFSQLCRAESEDGRMFTDQEIVDHLNFLLMAAHDTTTSALTTMAWALAQYPDWRSRSAASAWTTATWSGWN
jgi:cytochrome P450